MTCNEDTIRHTNLPVTNRTPDSPKETHSV